MLESLQDRMARYLETMKRLFTPLTAEELKANRAARSPSADPKRTAKRRAQKRSRRVNAKNGRRRGH